MLLSKATHLTLKGRPLHWHKVNKTLTNLCLAYNGIGDAGATSIGEVIKVNKMLTNLNLYGNCMSDPDATSIAGTIKVNKTLTN